MLDGCIVGADGIPWWSLSHQALTTIYIVGTVRVPTMCVPITLCMRGAKRVRGVREVTSFGVLHEGFD